MTETTASASSLMQTNSDDMENELATIQVPDHHGFSEYRLDKHDTLNFIKFYALTSRSATWVFAGGQMMQPEQLAEAAFATIGVIRITPGLVGYSREEGLASARKRASREAILSI